MAAPPVDDSPVNIKELEEALDIDGAKEIAAGFLEDVATADQRLSDSVKQRDQNGLRSTAHMLKGCCRIIFARHTAALATDMELIAIESRWEDAERILPELISSFYQTVECLKKYLQ